MPTVNSSQDMLQAALDRAKRGVRVTMPRTTGGDAVRVVASGQVGGGGVFGRPMSPEQRERLEALGELERVTELYNLGPEALARINKTDLDQGRRIQTVLHQNMLDLMGFVQWRSGKQAPRRFPGETITPESFVPGGAPGERLGVRVGSMYWDKEARGGKGIWRNTGSARQAGISPGGSAMGPGGTTGKMQGGVLTAKGGGTAAFGGSEPAHGGRKTVRAVPKGAEHMVPKGAAEERIEIPTAAGDTVAASRSREQHLKDTIRTYRLQGYGRGDPRVAPLYQELREIQRRLPSEQAAERGAQREAQRKQRAMENVARIGATLDMADLSKTMGKMSLPDRSQPEVQTKAAYMRECHHEVAEAQANNRPVNERFMTEAAIRAEHTRVQQMNDYYMKNPDKVPDHLKDADGNYAPEAPDWDTVYAEVQAGMEELQGRGVATTADDPATPPMTPRRFAAIVLRGLLHRPKLGDVKKLVESIARWLERQDTEPSAGGSAPAGQPGAGAGGGGQAPTGSAILDRGSSGGAPAAGGRTAAAGGEVADRLGSWGGWGPPAGGPAPGATGTRGPTTTPQAPALRKPEMDAAYAAVKRDPYSAEAQRLIAPLSPAEVRELWRRWNQERGK